MGFPMVLGVLLVYYQIGEFGFFIFIFMLSCKIIHKFLTISNNENTDPNNPTGFLVSGHIRLLLWIVTIGSHIMRNQWKQGRGKQAKPFGPNKRSTLNSFKLHKNPLFSKQFKSINYAAFLGAWSQKVLLF